MPTYQRSAIRTVDDVIAVANHAGSHFFDAATMRFFDSRILDGVYAPDGYQAVEGNRFFFVTSERHGDDAPRHYTVRVMTLSAQGDDRPYVDIVTVGGYYYTAQAAHKAAQTESDAIRYIDA